MAVRNTDALGVHQSDVIFHSALVEALADLRRNPWLLDYVFASLAQDDLTSKLYGEKQITLAKEWYLKTEIPVVMNLHAEGATYPCISLALVSSDEVENTLGDVHYDPTEDNSDSWPALYGPFTPVSYDYKTGSMVLPTDVEGKLVIVPGMVIVDKTGKSYDITDVTDSTHITLTAGVTGNFNGASVKGSKPAMLLELESCNFKEVYSIGAHVTDDGKGTTLSWLYSIVKFMLLRYRQSLMEARGFERTVLSFTPPKLEIEETAGAEQRFLSRYATITGYARDIWPKRLLQKITSTTVLTKLDDAVPPTTVTEIDYDLYDSFGNPIAR